MLTNISPSCQALLSTLARIAERHGVPVHVVGGLIRDALAGRRTAMRNIDVTIPRRAEQVGRALANTIHGAFIVLDEPHGSYRVVLGSGADRIECDLNDYRAADLRGDLGQRDFTVNAMAVPLETVLHDRDQWESAIIDPQGGRRDLAQGVIRAVFPGTFADDPLRILRGVTCAARFDWHIESQTMHHMRAAVGRLVHVSGERIRDEIFRLLETPRALPHLRTLDSVGAMRILFPETNACRGSQQGSYHHVDVWQHTLEAIAQFEETLTTPWYPPHVRAAIEPYLTTCVAGDRSRRALLKLITLLHDIGKPATRAVDGTGRLWFHGHEHVGATMAGAVADRLKLSTRERDTIRTHIRAHLRPGHLSRSPVITHRAIYRFFRDTGETGPGILLVWMADRMATRGPKISSQEVPRQRQAMIQLLEAYFCAPEEHVRPPRLVTGHDLMQAFHLPAGPRIGALLRAIAEAQVEREVTTRDEALALAKQWLR